MINQVITKKIPITSITYMSGRDYKYVEVEDIGTFEWTSSGTPDNVFVFAAPDGGVWTCKNLLGKGVYKISHAGILSGDLADKTSILNTIFAKSEIKAVEIDAQQSVRVDGTLTISSGKVLRILPGGSVYGVGTINGGIIWSEDFKELDQLLANTLTLNLEASYVFDGSGWTYTEY